MSLVGAFVAKLGVEKKLFMSKCIIFLTDKFGYLSTHDLESKSSFEYTLDIL